MMQCLQTEAGRVAVAGSGFLADGYDLAIIGPVLHVINAAYVCQGGAPCQAGEITAADFRNLTGAVNSAALVGAIFGQLVVGALADRLGRRVIFVLTGVLIVVASGLSALARPDLIPDVGPQQLLYQIAAARFVVGFGVGGELPLSGSIAAEGTSAKRRTVLMSLVYTSCCVGVLLCPTMLLLLVALDCPPWLLWRLGLAFGGAMPLVSLYFRWKMHESDDYRKVEQQRAQGAPQVMLMPIVRLYRWHLFGTSFNWFLFNGLYFSTFLFQGEIMAAASFGPEGLVGTFEKSLVSGVLVLVGGCVGVFLVQFITLRQMQLQSWLALVLLYAVCAMGYSAMLSNSPALLVVIYATTFFFLICGPGMSTYIIPAQIYPSQAKGTLIGISAACGKLGASLFVPLTSSLDLDTTSGRTSLFILCAVVSSIGALTSLFFTPRYDDEDLARILPTETVGFVPLWWQRARRQKEGEECSNMSDTETESSSTMASGI